MSTTDPHDNDPHSPASSGDEWHSRDPYPEQGSEPPQIDAHRQTEHWLASLKVYPGPGLLEACGWVAFFFALQIGFGLVVLVGMILAFGARNQVDIEALISDRTDLFLGLTTFFTYLILIPVGWYRLSPQATRKLNLSAPTLAQFLLVLSLVMPLGSVADVLFVQGEAVLETLLGNQFAQLRDATDVREALGQLQDAPLWALLFIIAVLPAVGEEFLFRGLIGRGLINRYGIAIGVFVTSVFFACVHLYPPHVLAILPVGFVIHFVYLSTRSYWMPMLFHFTNNALAVAGLKYGTDAEQPVWMAAVGAAYVIMGLWGLWLIRTRYVTESETAAASPEHDRIDSEFDTAFEQLVPVVGAEAPPADYSIHRRAPVAAGITILALLMLTLQAGILWSTFSAEPDQDPPAAAAQRV